MSDSRLTIAACAASWLTCAACDDSANDVNGGPLDAATASATLDAAVDAVALPGRDPRCRLPCYPKEPNGCDERSAEQLESFDEYRAKLLEACARVPQFPLRDGGVRFLQLDGGPSLWRTSAAEGRCANGVRALVTRSGLGGGAHFYAPDGRFHSVEFYRDYIDEICLGMTYWPAPSECERPRTITAVRCGTLFEVGESF